MRVGLGHSRQTEALPTLAGMSALPPKANFPILELLPSPTLSERRHRRLARRIIAVRRLVLESGSSMRITGDRDDFLEHEVANHNDCYKNRERHAEPPACAIREDDA